MRVGPEERLRCGASHYAYFLATFRFDKAENEPVKNLQKNANLPKFATFANPNKLEYPQAMAACARPSSRVSDSFSARSEAISAASSVRRPCVARSLGVGEAVREPRGTEPNELFRSAFG